jgi:hypothetical protein
MSVAELSVGHNLGDLPQPGKIDRRSGWGLGDRSGNSLAALGDDDVLTGLRRRDEPR